MNKMAKLKMHQMDAYREVKAHGECPQGQQYHTAYYSLVRGEVVCKRCKTTLGTVESTELLRKLAHMDLIVGFGAKTDSQLTVPINIVRSNVTSIKPRPIKAEPGDLETLQCTCGYRLGLDAEHQKEHGYVKIPCPACSTELNTKFIFKED